MINFSSKYSLEENKSEIPSDEIPSEISVIKFIIDENYNNYYILLF
jgi:hypothetical protein